MTPVSRLTLRYSNVAAIAAARRENFRMLSQRLSGVTSVKLLHSDPPPEGCPWVFPLIFEKHRDAHRTIRANGVPAVAWDGVRPRQLGIEHVDADFLYHHLIFLPVHQGLKPEHIDDIASAVEMVVSQSPA
jgi:dTDP-4-amino-4,6-dideoxygalactose transaminase